MPRMQAFATEPARTPPHHPGSVSGAIPKVRPSPPSSKQQETRQRQLDSLRRMEDRLESLASVEQKAREKAAASKAKATDNAAVASPAPPSEEEEEEEEGGVSRVAGVIRDTSETLMRLPELKLPAPRSKVDNSEGKCEVAEAVAFVIDSTPDPTKTDNPSQREQERGDAVPKKKVLKRRNQAIYAQNEDE